MSKPERPPAATWILGIAALLAIVGLFTSAGMLVWTLPLVGKLFGYSGLTLLAVLLAAKVIDP